MRLPAGAVATHSPSGSKMVPMDESSESDPINPAHKPWDWAVQAGLVLPRPTAASFSAATASAVETAMPAEEADASMAAATETT